MNTKQNNSERITVTPMQPNIFPVGKVVQLTGKGIGQARGWWVVKTINADGSIELERFAGKRKNQH